LSKGVKDLFYRHTFCPVLQLKIFAILIFLLICAPLLVTTAMALETIPVEGEPIALALDEKGGRLFSLNYFNKTISVIDEKKLKVVKTIELGKRINRNVGTNAILYDSSLGQLLASTGGGEVLIFNGSTLELTGEIRIDRFIPDLASDGDFLYLPDWSGDIHKYKDSQADSVINHGLMASPYMHMAGNKRIYLSSGKKGFLVIDAEKGEVVKKLEINALSTPASSNESVFVAGTGKLFVINGENLEIEKMIDLDYGNFGGLGLTYNPANAYLYAITANNTVTVVDPNGAGSIVGKMDVCNRPVALAANKKTGVVYVACPSDEAIAVLKD